MKKIIRLIFALFVLFEANVFAQLNVAVPLNDEIYDFLETAQTKGLCHKLNGYKPYTKNQVIAVLEEIIENQELMTESENEIAQALLIKYKDFSVGKKNFFLGSRVSNEDSENIFSFNYHTKFESAASGGFYSKSDYSSWGMDNMYSFCFDGDVGNNFSYRINTMFDITRMPLKSMGDYFIGYDWYSEEVPPFLDGQLKDDGTEYAPPKRFIRSFTNNSYLPYSYHKTWAGQVYFLKNLDASGLEGWPLSWSITGSIEGEIRAAFLDEKIILGFGRMQREIAGMDNGSSLVLNSFAQPFMAIDSTFKVFDTLKFYALAGVLEYPNQDYINDKSFPASANSGNLDDSYFFQNAFSVNMVEVDYKGFHFDFGGTCVWPKRFELGYLFPLCCYVEYQNHIGDCDNLSMFGDLKYTINGLGSVWASLYLDEINFVNNNPFTATRAMYAIQGGVKYIIPKLPFASLSFRYTKVEPYCYTHHSINYTPWYNHYISENYSNNGESLGYYLPPNSDEFLLSFKIKPVSILSAGASYQLIRHGADYGSQQVPGSSLYSELSNKNRDKLKKYFLHDGAYNWSHILSAGGKLTLNTKYPVSVYGNFGLIYSYFTVIDSEKYDRSVYGNNGNCKDADFSTPYSIANTDEYPNLFGAVLTLGASISF